MTRSQLVDRITTALVTSTGESMRDKVAQVTAAITSSGATKSAPQVITVGEVRKISSTAVHVLTTHHGGTYSHALKLVDELDAQDLLALERTKEEMVRAMSGRCAQCGAERPLPSVSS